jgi:hypothetical protein
VNRPSKIAVIPSGADAGRESKSRDFGHQGVVRALDRKIKMMAGTAGVKDFLFNAELKRTEAKLIWYGF